MVSFEIEPLPEHGVPLEETGEPRERHPKTRHCPECGVKVCSYKDVKLNTAWCYAHDHLTPWTVPYITDKKHIDRSSPCYNKKDERIPVE